MDEQRERQAKAMGEVADAELEQVAGGLPAIQKIRATSARMQDGMSNTFLIGEDYP